MKQRIAVLGAAGYLGRRVTKALHEEGHDVVAVVHRHAPPMAVETAACDAADRAALQAVLRGADVVVNSVAAKPGTMVAIADNLAGLLRQDAVGQIIQISSLAVYGQERGLLHEFIQPLPARRHAYAAAKRQCELALSETGWAAARSVILRPGCLYGPGAPVWVDGIARLIRSGRLGWLGPHGQGIARLLHVDDAARIVAHCIGKPCTGPHNLLGPETITWNEYFVRLASLLGALPLRNMGGWALTMETWLAGPLGRTITTGAQAHAHVTPAMRRLFRNEANIVSAKAPLLRSAEHRPLQDGLAEAAQTFLHAAPATEGHAPLVLAESVS
jgi:nucleoside-diphosphate-sugar epimerase